MRVISGARAKSEVEILKPLGIRDDRKEERPRRPRAKRLDRVGASARVRELFEVYSNGRRIERRRLARSAVRVLEESYR